MADKAVGWITFLRKYGPIAQNDNMYDEHIRKSSRRLGIRPIEFPHPIEKEVLSIFQADASPPASVILTGTAGDGKSHLCGKVWRLIGGGDTEWASDEIYYQRENIVGGKPVTIHIIRDLTALPDRDDQNRYTNRRELLERFCESIFTSEPTEVFLIAGNDGQLVESWQRLGDSDLISKTRSLFESFLVEGLHEKPGVSLKFFNLSRVNSSILLDLTLDALLSHEGWQECYERGAEELEFFGNRCPHSAQL